MSRRLAAWILLIALISAGGYASRAISGPPDRDVLYKYSTATGGLVQYLILGAIVYAIAVNRSDLFALRRPRSWKRALLYAGGILIASYAIFSALEPLLHAGREQGLTPTHWEPRHAGAYAANFVVVAGVAPFVEELTFRGVGYSLLERFGRWPAILAVGIAFAASHGLVQGLPDLMIFGSGLAWLRSKTGSVYPGMLLHAAFNAVSLIAAVTT